MPKAPNEQLAEMRVQLVKALAREGVSRAELADHLDVTTQAVDNWCNAHREPDVRTVARIERRLNIPGVLMAALGYPHEWLPLGGLVRSGVDLHPGSATRMRGAEPDDGDDLAGELRGIKRRLEALEAEGRENAAPLSLDAEPALVLLAAGEESVVLNALMQSDEVDPGLRQRVMASLQRSHRPGPRTPS